MSAEFYPGMPVDSEAEGSMFDKALEEQRQEKLAQVRAELEGSSPEVITTPEQKYALIRQISNFIVTDLRQHELPIESREMLQDLREAA